MVTNKKLVGTAQTRAAILAFLHNNPGEHMVREVADSVGVSSISAGQLLANMKNSKLIDGHARPGKDKKMLYQGLGSVEQVPALAESGERVVKRRAKKTAVSHKDTVPYYDVKPLVEFVIGGVMVRVGRNNQTGILRFSVDDE